MSQRRSLRLPITLGVVLIVLVVSLAVGWIVLTISGALSAEAGAVYWTLLAIGTVGFIVVLVGVSIYLSLSVKAINVTRRQSNFIDSVTHELKSPIASLKLYLQTLNRRQVDEGIRTEFYQLMLDDVRRLDQLIDHVLNVARLDKTRTDDEAKLIDLSEVIRTCSKTVCQHHHVPADAIKLELQRCFVSASPMDVEIIFRNLLDNAVKYSGENPEVSVTIDFPSPEEACIHVMDNGPGIPLKERRRIFRRFERLGLELERTKPGLGLGLFLVRTLVRRLRGRIHARGRLDGQGMLFEVCLPVSRAAENHSTGDEIHSADRSHDGTANDEHAVDKFVARQGTNELATGSSARHETAPDLLGNR